MAAQTHQTVAPSTPAGFLPTAQGLSHKIATNADPIILSGILTICAFIMLKRAWVTEDAFITFRTIDNFISGYGLRWNVAERVQSYTHPLWMLLHCAFMAVTREAYYTSLCLSLACSLTAVALLVLKLARSTRLAFLATAILVVSSGFVDFSTSGLENPLSHLLLVYFAWQYLKPQTCSNHLLRLATTASLLVLNRMDTLLLVLPALSQATLATAIRERSSTGMWWRRPAKAFALGFAPFLIWELFSLVYYGFLFPNTAYAKLNGIPTSELVTQGIKYYSSSFERDPGTLFGIGLGLFSVFIGWRRQKPLCLAAGILAYLLYTLNIGGDFMLSRFFTAPLVLSTCLLASTPQLATPRWVSAITVLTLAVGIKTPGTPLASEKHGAVIDQHQVADERAYYFDSTGLVHAERGKGMPNHPWGKEGYQTRAKAGINNTFEIQGNIGFYGYGAGPQVFIVDHLALTDPLLARIPAKRNTDWRPGHLARVIPEGYLTTLSLMREHQPYQCHMQDENLCHYYEKLQLVTRGPLFSLDRFITIVGFAFHRYDHWIDFEKYHLPDLVRVPIEKLSQAKQEHAPSGSEGTIAFSDSGLDVLLPQPSHTARWELSLNANFNNSYKLLFFQGKSELAQLSLQPSYTEGLHLHTVTVPAHTVHSGYDRVRILPTGGNHQCSIGHLRPL